MISSGTRAELFWVVSGQGLTLLLGIVTLKALTYLLGAENYGQFALGLSIAGTLNMFVYGPLGHAVSRYYHHCAEDGRLGEFDRLVVFLLRATALVVSVVGIAVALWMASGANRAWAGLVATAVGYGVAAGTLSIQLADLNTRRERRLYAVLQSADALLRLIGAVALALLAGASASLAMTGFVLGSVVALLLARRARGPGATSTPSVPAGSQGLFGADALGRQVASYTSSISLFAIPAIFASYGDRWIIEHTMSDAHVGIYVALAQIANAPANLILSVFSQTMNPILFQRAGNASSGASMRDSRNLLYRAVLPLVAMLVLVCGVSFVLGEWIVVTMTSAEFAPHAHLLWVLVLAAAIFQIAQALASEAFMYNRPVLLFFPKLAHAVAFLGLSLWLIDSRQLDGVALAAVVAAVVYLPMVVMTNAGAARRLGATASFNSDVDHR